MQPIKSWFSFDSGTNPQINIIGLGINEEMQPYFVDRPKGTDDYLFMFFYDQVCLGIKGEKQFFPPGHLKIWKPGQRQY